jgi:hypothetical protein
MQKNLMRRPPMTPSGNLTAQAKLAYIAEKLGLPGIKGMQGSTRNLYDTVLLSTAATTRQTLNFFSAANNKSRNFSNFQALKLGAGEAMVFEQVQFFLLTLSAANLALDATTISSIVPLSQVNATPVTLKEGLQLGIMNLSIANSTVVKDFVINETNPNFNPKTTGIALGTLQTGATFDTMVFPEENIGQNTIYLESPPVLPPDQGFQLTLELPPIGTVTGSLAIACVVGRFGSIFSAKTTL